MIHRPLSAIAAAAMLVSSIALAQGDFGTAQQAKSMLERAVAAVKMDKSRALEMFNNGQGGFRDRDLYPFCYDAKDGRFVAVGTNVRQLLGTDVRDLKDPDGKAYGRELYAAAQRPEGEMSEVSYVFVRPGGDGKPLPKVTFVAHVADLACAVGYYR